MDDPDHLRARRSDLNNFRRWDRTRSYTYGERPNVEEAASPSNSRPVSTGTTLNMAAGGKRAPALKGKLGLSTLQEDADSSCAGSESSHDGIGDSPCPPSAALFRAGTIRPRVLGRTASAAIPNRR
jgi:M-phase inducer tyrosine phosphatase